MGAFEYYECFREFTSAQLRCGYSAGDVFGIQSDRPQQADRRGSCTRSDQFASRNRNWQTSPVRTGGTLHSRQIFLSSNALFRMHVGVGVCVCAPINSLLMKPASRGADSTSCRTVGLSRRTPLPARGTGAICRPHRCAALRCMPRIPVPSTCVAAAREASASDTRARLRCYASQAVERTAPIVSLGGSTTNVLLHLKYSILNHAHRLYFFAFTERRQLESTVETLASRRFMNTRKRRTTIANLVESFVVFPALYARACDWLKHKLRETGQPSFSCRFPCIAWSVECVHVGVWLDLSILVRIGEYALVEIASLLHESLFSALQFRDRSLLQVYSYCST